MVENNRSIGIMQGRLTKTEGRGIQFFPFEEWKEEFVTAQKIGIDEIEWIFDYPRYQDNPLWTQEGCKEIAHMISGTSVKVHSICWHYFVRRPFYKFESEGFSEVLTENKLIMKKILNSMNEIGAKLVEIPMLDDSSVKNLDEEKKVIDFIRWVCDLAKEHGILVGLETDFPPGKFVDFLNKIDRDNVVANYDSGNSSGLGYNHKEELLSLGSYVYNVHIKDRVKGNGTVALGTGSADFEEVFSTLNEIGYKNSFILEAARGEEGKETNNIEQQLEFVRAYINKFF